jgi:hypothetical protein
MLDCEDRWKSRDIFTGPGRSVESRSIEPSSHSPKKKIRCFEVEFVKEELKGVLLRMKTTTALVSEIIPLNFERLPILKVTIHNFKNRGWQSHTQQCE